MISPAFTIQGWTVIPLARSASRKAMASATSPSVPIRRRGMRAVSSLFQDIVDMKGAPPLREVAGCLQPAAARAFRRTVHDPVDGAEPVQGGLGDCAAVGLIRDVGGDGGHPLPGGVDLVGDGIEGPGGAGSESDVPSLPE